MSNNKEDLLIERLLGVADRLEKRGAKMTAAADTARRHGDESHEIQCQEVGQSCDEAAEAIRCALEGIDSLFSWEMPPAAPMHTNAK